MNTGVVTEGKLEWTSLGLNLLLSVYRDFESISKKDTTTDPSFVKGTAADVAKIYQKIVHKLTLVPHRNRRVWNSQCWYNEIPEEFRRFAPPSDKLEEAFSSVANLYVSHQYGWDNAEEAELMAEVEEPESEPDSDASSTSDSDEEDD